MLQFSSAPVRPSLVMPVLAAIVAVAIFVVDTVTPLDIAIAVLYVAVVLLAMDFAGQRGILIVAAGCAALTVLSYVITHNHDPASGPFLRGLISLVAIGVTAALAARHQGTIEVLREHANLLDLTHDTIFVRNHDDVITYWNRAAAELYGWRRERVASRWAVQRDGRGRPAAILETNNDITGQRTVEDGLHRARSELAHVARVATLGELTASIAHEVNQPLAAVVTNGEACLRWLAREVPDLAQARSSVEHMIKNGQRASEVVRRLRALSRKADPNYAAVSLVDVVNDVALLVGRELLAHRTTLAVNGPAELWVNGDRVQRQQVVMNLLMNGIQAMDGVHDRPRQLTVDLCATPEGALLVVSDKGPGIDAETMGRLFDAFYTTKTDGMGMGLSISRSIVEAHGGRIWATNDEGTGARLHVSLPALAEQPT